MPRVRLLLLACLLASLFSPGCARLPTPAPTLTSQTAPALVCPSDFCRKPSLSSGQSAGCAPAAARELAPYRRLSLSMTFAQVCAAVGIPDWETGSGLSISVYDLTDGSRVLIGWSGPDQMVYFRLLLPDGTSQPLAGTE